ncbi:hypothetical protein ACFE04_030224 [Oxalis oulophora]
MGEHDQSRAIPNPGPIMKLMLAIGHTMTLKCVVDLRLADILHSFDGPITLFKLASLIDSPTPPDTSALKRIMRLLVHNQIFTSHEPSTLEGGETLYGVSELSSWLLHDSDVGVSPMISSQTIPMMTLPWCYLSQCVKEGGTGFEKAHGCKMYDFASKNPEFNDMFNHAMASQKKLITMLLRNMYKDGFKSVATLVDIGGGTGEVVAEIVKEHLHINGINFDLPHVVSTAPEYNGVTHVGGDMFQEIPKGDVIIMKVNYKFFIFVHS